MTELSDDLLVAYVDGQLARDQSRAVKRVLDQDIVAAQRAESLKAAHDRLERVFDALLEDEKALLMGDLDDALALQPEPLQPELQKSGSALRAKLIPIGAVALLLVGLAGGYGIWGLKPAAPVSNLATPVAIPAWQQDVARAQSLVGRDSLEVSLDTQGNADFIAFQLAKALGTDVVIPDLSASGHKFARAQLLRRQSQPLAQLFYLPDTGLPLAVYMKPGASAEVPEATRALAGLVTVSWAEKGIDYFIAGQANEATLSAVAKEIRRQISGL